MGGSPMPLLPTNHEASLWGVAHSVTLRLNKRLILILVLPNIAATLASLLR